MTRMLRPIPIPGMPIPNGTAARTKPQGFGWYARGSTKKGAVRRFHAKQYNKMTRDLSILNTGRICDED